MDTRPPVGLVVHYVLNQKVHHYGHKYGSGKPYDECAFLDGADPIGEVKEPLSPVSRS